MTVSKEQFDELLILTRPVVEWLRQNIHPHASVVIDCGRVELVEGIASASIPFEAAQRGEEQK